MKTINIDGEEYVLKKDVEENMVKKESEFKIVECVKDRLEVLAIGSAELTGEWVRTTISVDYLRNIARALHCVGIQGVDIIFTKDKPVIFGKVKDNKASGFILAPRVSND